jgi:hypothetical protein
MAERQSRFAKRVGFSSSSFDGIALLDNLHFRCPGVWTELRSNSL